MKSCWHIKGEGGVWHHLSFEKERKHRYGRYRSKDGRSGCTIPCPGGSTCRCTGGETASGVDQYSTVNMLLRPAGSSVDATHADVRRLLLLELVANAPQVARVLPATPDIHIYRRKTPPGDYAILG